MIPVESTNVRSIGYNPSRARIFVRFNDGMRLYYYDPVPPVVWLGFFYSQSKGSYLHTQIIPFFRCTRAKETDLNES